jgi:four helix bundle protein
MGGNRYEDLELWQRAMDLVVECYAASKTFPSDELFGLTSQLRRAAVSVPANVAEGQARQHRGEFIQHLSIACGSLAEVETHVRIAQRLGYLSDKSVGELLLRCKETGRLMYGLLRFLRGGTQPFHGGAQRLSKSENRQPATENRKLSSKLSS